MSATVALAELERRRRERAKRYRDDPVGYLRDGFGLILWEWDIAGKGLVGQAPIARVVSKNASLPLSRWVAIRSGHKVGKSMLIAGLAIWWFDTRNEGRVVITSSSFTQVENINWPDVARLWKSAKFARQGKLGDTPRTGVDYDNGRKYIIGLSTDVAENIGGYSGSEFLWLIDEASGIDEKIFEAIIGNTAGNSMVVMVGNPTQPVGTFFDAFNDNASEHDIFHLSSWDTPNAQTGENLVPGLAIRAWCEQRKERWGENDPRYKVRVLGEFPSTGVATVFPQELIERMFVEDNDAVEGVLAIGVDVARFGDDVTVIQAVRGNRAFVPKQMHQADSRQIITAIRTMVETLRYDGEIPIVRIDTIGVGFAVFDGMQHAEWCEVVSVNAAQRLDENPEYHNVRAAMYFGLLAWAKNGGRCQENRLLRQELSVTQYEFTAKNKIIVEEKKAIRKKLKRSPDFADALALAVYGGRTQALYSSLNDQSDW